MINERLCPTRFGVSVKALSANFHRRLLRLLSGRAIIGSVNRIHLSMGRSSAPGSTGVERACPAHSKVFCAAELTAIDPGLKRRTANWAAQAGGRGGGQLGHPTSRSGLVNGSTGAIRRAWARRARTAVVVTATAVAALLAAGCGGRRPVTWRSSPQPRLRRRALPRPIPRRGRQERTARLRPLHARPRGAELPRPDRERAREGELAAARGQQLRFQSASRACDHLLPNGGSGPSPAQVPAGESAGTAVLPLRARSRCPELSRPGQRRAHTPTLPPLESIRARRSSSPQTSPGVPAPVHALECCLQRLREVAWLTGAAESNQGRMTTRSSIRDASLEIDLGFPATWNRSAGRRAASRTSPANGIPGRALSGTDGSAGARHDHPMPRSAG